MIRNRSLWTLRAALLVVIVVTLMWAPSVWAQSKVKTLYTFTGGGDGDGRSPTAGVIFDGAGNLYGTTRYGGGGSECRPYRCGIVFKLTPNPKGEWHETVLYRFTGGKDGNQPIGGLIFDVAGNLYGTTVAGGAYGDGTVFELSPKQDGSWTESVLYSFCSMSSCTDGSAPFAGLLFDPRGNLYGTTYYGGATYEAGTVFKLTPNSDGSWTENVVYSFCALSNCGDGANSYADLILDQTGNLYGTTYFGGTLNHGTAFELMPGADGKWIEKVLHSFTRGQDGGNPQSSLIFDQTGNLYGTTTAYGAYRYGTVFKLAPDGDGSWKASVLSSFKGGEGYKPEAGLIFDSAGNLYGTTAAGVGAYPYGTVFKLTPGADGDWKETVLHHFSDHPGAVPKAVLILDKVGNLYGTTAGEDITPPATFGSVFEIAP
jgi:uncharacterized repeat protein (TIGR03803 family)